MKKRSAPNRSQGREEKMQAASFFASSTLPVNGDGQSASAQRARLLDALRRGSLTTLEARRLLDVLHPAARVMELRREGLNIVTVWTTDLTPEGNAHRVARYILRGGGA